MSALSTFLCPRGNGVEMSHIRFPRTGTMSFRGQGSEVGKDVLFEGFVTNGGMEECLSPRLPTVDLCDLV